MSGVTRIEIHESAAEFAKRLQAETHPKLKERLQVLYLLALPGAMSISKIAGVVGKHRGTVQRWLAAYGVTSGLKRLVRESLVLCGKKR